MSDQKRTTCYLVTRVGDEPAQALIWDTIEITVGRLETQDIVLADPEVSREHAVFRKRGECCSVVDLDTTLGVLVNDRPVKEHELQPGDTVRIGPLSIQFGRSEEQLRRGPNVRFASELKGFALPSGAEGGGTMLALNVEADPLPTSPTVDEPSASRAVSATGELEELEKPEDLNPFELDDEDPCFGAAASASVPDHQSDAQPALKPLAAMETQSKMRFVLELEGPHASLQSIASALLDKTIEVPPVKITLSKPNPT